jgi:hypothetical protein
MAGVVLIFDGIKHGPARAAQRKPVDCEISFHYDKDEGLSTSTADARMVCPVRSTVTYLSPLGSPTVVLDTCSVDGTTSGTPRQALLSCAFRCGCGCALCAISSCALHGARGPCGDCRVCPTRS